MPRLRLPFSVLALQAPPRGAGTRRALGDPARRLAGRVAGEDLAHDLSLGPVDHPAATNGLTVRVVAPHKIVTISVPAARLARLDPAAKAPPGLVRQIFEKERVHRALESNM